MITDRCSTIIIMVLAITLHKKYVSLMTILLIGDVSGHWMYMISSISVGKSSHKTIERNMWPILRLYYSTVPGRPETHPGRLIRPVPRVAPCSDQECHELCPSTLWLQHAARPGSLRKNKELLLGIGGSPGKLSSRVPDLPPKSQQLS
ncbi:CDP-diacylglycerol-inositol 3-phosphatidyltransferase isoform 1 [Cryptosporidium canis]|uniref:CDP-diacylglycerol-inositol 3-phosphatidyltransferase isoform 1 n=1 Tax=Cryptosporidium canis TaxID=195482 RepID=A0A9D5DIK8_9CRYT|nr:CDP-diacylglycerol-inositol 3-phosphatidyltransferase isoform 1 [Cryptosporidium canis]